MATLGLTDVQTILASLITQYKALAAQPVIEMSASQRSLRRQTLAELRAEIEAWSQTEAEMGGDSGTIALATFGNPQ